MLASSLAVATDTDDAQGRTLASASDRELADIMRSVDAQAILDEFTGELEQLPPAYSAIKKNGVVAYKAAREGTCLELEARHVTVYGAQLVGAGVCEAELICADGNTSVRELPFWDVHFDVSKGTYIRALARDIGAYLGCGAHLGSLRRTSVATMGIDEACSIDELADRAEAGGMRRGATRLDSWDSPSSSSASNRRNAWQTVANLPISPQARA